MNGYNLRHLLDMALRGGPIRVRSDGIQHARVKLSKNSKISEHSLILSRNLLSVRMVGHAIFRRIQGSLEKKSKTTITYICSKNIFS